MVRGASAEVEVTCSCSVTVVSSDSSVLELGMEEVRYGSWLVASSVSTEEEGWGVSSVDTAVSEGCFMVRNWNPQDLHLQSAPKTSGKEVPPYPSSSKGPTRPPRERPSSRAAAHSRPSPSPPPSGPPPVPPR